MDTLAQFNDQLAGIQLAVFEIVWPAIPALTALHVNIRNQSLELHCAAQPALSVKDRADCERLLKEVLESALPGAATVVKFDSAAALDAVEVMSPRIFESIAEAVAPWRSKQAR